MTSKIELGLGWLRVVAQGYNYSCSKMELVSNFQNNLKSCIVQLGWGVDGCVRWRKVTVTVTIKMCWGKLPKGFKELGRTIGLVRGWLRAVAQGYNYSCNKSVLGSNFQNNLWS